MKKCLSVLMALTMVLTMLSGSVYATGEQAGANIIAPAVGQVISDSTMIVSGTLPEACVSAKLLIDGAEVKDVSDSGADFKASVDISSYGYGLHKITLDADGNQIDRFVTFTGEAAVVERGTNFTGGSGATSSNMGGWGCSFGSNLTVNSDSGFRIYTVDGENGRIGRTYAKKNDGYVRVTMNNNRAGETINSGIFKLDADFSLTGDKVALQLAVRDRGGNGGYYLLDNLVGSNEDGTKNIFTDRTEFETGKTYHLTVLIDIDRKTRTYIVDDKIMVNDQKLTRADVLSCVDHFYFELTQQSSTDATMTITNLNLTTIERYPFITMFDGREYDENAYVLYTNENVSFNLANVVVSSCVNSQNIVLKENGSKVEAAVSSSNGKTVTVAPANGFTDGAVYSVEMNNLEYAFSENNTSYSLKYPKTLIAEFNAVSEFCIISPEDGYVSDGADCKLEVMVPSGYSDLEVLIDGKKTDASTEDGIIYVSDIEYDKFNIGNHLIEVSAINDGEICKVSQWFKTSASVSSEVKEEYPSMNVNTWSPTVVSSCEGSDNSANGGYRITANNNNAYYYINNTAPKLSLTGTVVFEADIKRDESSNVYMVARNSAISNGSLVTDRNFIVAADGALVGTGIKVPAGEWHNYRIVTNLATKEYKLYYDKALVAEGTNPIAVGSANAIPDSLGFIQLQVWCPTTTQGISVDNVKLYAYELNSDASVVSQAKGDNVSDVNSNIISAMADTVVVDLGSFDEINTGNVTVTSGGKAVEAENITYDADDKTLTLSIPALEADSVLEIAIDEVSQNGKVFAKPYSVIAKVNCDIIGDIAVNGDTASVTLGKGSDSSYSIDAAKFVIASYNGNKLVGVTFKDADIQADKITVNSVKYDGEAGGTEYKAFLWSGFDSLKPIAK